MFKPVKVVVTCKLDADIVAWLKQGAKAIKPDLIPFCGKLCRMLSKMANYLVAARYWFALVRGKNFLSLPLDTQSYILYIK